MYIKNFSRMQHSFQVVLKTTEQVILLELKTIPRNIIFGGDFNVALIWLAFDIGNIFIYLTFFKEKNQLAASKYKRAPWRSSN